MKIAVFHSSRSLLGEDSSGSGTYEKSLAKLLNQLSSHENLKISHFVPRKLGFGFRKLSVLGLDIYEFRSGLLERIASSWPGSFLARMLESSPLMSTARFLRSEQFEIAYFSSPSPLALRLGAFPYLFTVWDLGHIDLPGFPEVWSQSTWVGRERTYYIGIGRASHVLVDSAETGARIQERYGIPSHRWTSIGLLPRIRENFDPSREICDDYIIYPAKVWPHKNHVTLLRALSLLKSEGVGLKLVFTGGDGGNLKRIREEARRLSLESDVLFLGQVDRQRLLGLISNSVALVMPSLLGPTNLPPLEALQLGTPAIVSDNHRFGPEIDSKLRKVPGHDFKRWAAEIRVLIDQPRAQKLKISERETLASLSSIFKEIQIFLELVGPGR